ncbi:MAG: hypothetical protein ACP5O3_01145 [Candidatus Micrarchaeia archaeon]|jgi:hypothetical protein
MTVSKAGIVSFLGGLVLMVAVWYFAFFQSSAGVVASIVSLIVSVLVAGVFWAGLFLFLIGLFILVL